jgi:hypothetical protein
MHGNVLEWCDAEPRDGPDLRVVRGGRFRNDANYSRAGFRVTTAPATAGDSWGLRVARVPTRTDVTALVQQWASGAWANHGFMLRDLAVVFPSSASFGQPTSRAWRVSWLRAISLA